MRAEGIEVVFEDGTVGLSGVSLALDPGRRVLLTGPSGSGKSTLLRVLAGLRVPVSGTVERDGRVGFVFQEPGDQLVAGTVGEELRLAARAAGHTVEPRALLDAVGLDVPLHTPPHALSGGQQQRLAVAACLAQDARVLLLDEPLAHLDPEGARDLLALTRELAEDGRAVCMVEHRLEATVAWADEVLVLDAGRLASLEPTVEAFEGLGLRAPSRLVFGGVDGLRALGSRSSRDHAVGPCLWSGELPAVERGGREVTASTPIALHRGERLALMGANGAGKSTLLEACARGLGRRAVWVPQDPDLSLFHDTVAEELVSGADERGVSAAVGLEELGLAGLDGRAPQSLSKGQRLRLAVGAALAVAPDVLLLDEPTAGQHAEAVAEVMEQVTRVQADRAVVFATHDLELALRWATRIAFVSEGRIVASGAPGALVPPTLPWLAAEQIALGFRVVDREQQCAGRTGAAAPAEVVSTRAAVVERPVLRATPVRSLLALGALACLSLLLERPLLLWGLVLLGGWTFFRRPLPRRTRWGVLLGALGVVWTTLVSQGLFYGDEPRTVAFRLGPLVVWEEGLRWGFVQSARLLAVTFAGLGVALSTSPDRMVGLLRAIRVPGALAFLGVMALRFVPVVASEWWSIRAARARRGRALWRNGPLRWLRIEVAMLQPLVARALRRALRLAESLDSRGFDLRRPPVEAVRWERMDQAVGAGLSVVVVTVAALQLLLALYVWEVYYDPSLRPLYAWARAWL